MTANRQYCTFFLDGLFCGVEVCKVQEVIGRHLEMTAVPPAPPEVRGLVNLRGQIVPVLDLRRRLSLPPRPQEKHVHVVVTSGDGTVSWLVDEVGDVLEVYEDAERPPNTLPPRVRDLILGVYKLREQLLAVLDPDKVVSLPASPDNLP